MKIKYFAWLKNFTNLDQEEINDSSITNINTLKKFLIKKYPNLKTYLIDQDIVRIAINLEYTQGNKDLSSDDEVALFPPVSGG